MSADGLRPAKNLFYTFTRTTKAQIRQHGYAFLSESLLSAAVIICFKGSVCQIQTLEGLLGLSRLLESNQGTIILPSYCNRNSKHLSRHNKNPDQKLSSQVAERLSITEISPNSIHVHVSKPINTSYLYETILSDSKNT